MKTTTIPTDFCCVRGCCELGPAYRRTPLDVLHHYCDVHAVQHGFTVGERPVEAVYGVEPDGYMPKSCYGGRSPRAREVQVVTAGGVVLETFASSKAFARDKGIPPHLVYGPLRCRYRCRGMYIRYAADAVGWSPARTRKVGPRDRSNRIAGRTE